MEIKERIALILKKHHLAPSAFADRIGANRSSISHILSGRNKPGLELLEKIIHHFPDVNAHWLITGVTNVNIKQGELESEALYYSKKETRKTTDLKEITKITEFYSDGTFKTYYPS